MKLNPFSTKNKYQPFWTALTHVLFWFLLFLPPILLKEGPPNFPSGNTFFFINLLVITLFYFNVYLLIPKVWQKKGIALYLIISIFILSFFVILIKYLFFLAGASVEWKEIIVRVSVLYVINWMVSFSYRIILDNAKKEKELKERETENLKTELSFLRSQVSPHFMFNVLNTIVSLTRQKSDKLESLVVELSNLMRYMLYDSDDEKVNLKTEIEYLISYVDIQKLRFGDKILVEFELPNEIPEISLEPMMLIPLIENAFKHGSIINKPEIKIALQVENGNLKLEISNKYVESSKVSTDKNSGIGLSNLKRRLSLLYPDKHNLSIEKRDQLFIVSLSLNFKK